MSNHALLALPHRAALKDRTPAQIGAHLAGRGWTNAWRGGIYAFHHDHSTTHEVLVIARGQARLTLGGEGGPQVQVGEEDVLLLPAGTGHRSDGSSADLRVAGAYAGRREWDLCRPEETDVQQARREDWAGAGMGGGPGVSRIGPAGFWRWNRGDFLFNGRRGVLAEHPGARVGCVHRSRRRCSSRL